MASVLSWPSGRSFKLVFKQRHTQSPTVVWGPHIWAYSIGSGTFDNLYDLAWVFRNFLRSIMLPQFEIGDVLVSTGAHDGDPYDPQTFMNIDFPWQAGQRAGAQGDSLAAEVVLWVTRAVQIGRQGHMYLRGILSEGDVWASAGKFVLANATAMATLLESAIQSSGVNNYLIGGSSTVLRIAMITTTGSYVRNLLGMSVRGVNLIKVGHKYFDRGPVTDGPTGHTELPDAADVLEEEAVILAGMGGTQWIPVEPGGTDDQPEE